MQVDPSVLADLVQFLHVCADQSHHEKEGQCCCLGLRISECLALKWSDVDWINGKLTGERGIVCQQVDDVKTTESRKSLAISPELLEAVKAWKQAAQFSFLEDWIFASPVQLGRLPWPYDQVWHTYQKAAGKAGVGWRTRLLCYALVEYAQ